MFMKSLLCIIKSKAFDHWSLKIVMCAPPQSRNHDVSIVNICISIKRIVAQINGNLHKNFYLK